jgi:hypothetical protein
LPNNEFGDFQTPELLVEQMLLTLPPRTWARVLEPTCGVGNVLRGVRDRLHPREIYGVEFQESYAAEASAVCPVLRRDVFALDFGTDIPWTSDGPLLVIGNPPWVTNAQQSTLRSTNLPPKMNARRLPGIEAMTGSSNFDIAEAIWLKLICELADQSPYIALLCKTQVARNLLQYGQDFKLPISESSIRPIDAMKWFGASVDACLLSMQLAPGASNYVADVYESLDAMTAVRRTGVVDGRFVVDVDGYAAVQEADGVSPVEWRQGVKHDAASVMELVAQDRGLVDASDHPVLVEDHYLYPLLKSTDLFHGRTRDVRRRLVVPQRGLGEDTSRLRTEAPMLWAYLNANSAALDARKSSIYKGRPRFCIFGVGAYTFAPFKIAVSGLHKEARFRVVGPIDRSPVAFDDTCYFVPANDPVHAALVAAILQSRQCTSLLNSIVSWDAKRPITKRVLQRLDLAVLGSMIEIADLEIAVRRNLNDLGFECVGLPTEQLRSQLLAMWGNARGTRPRTRGTTLTLPPRQPVLSGL